VRRLRQELWRQKLAVALRQRTVSHFLFHQGIFSQKKENMTVVSHLPYFSLCPQLNMKLYGRHSDTAEVIKAEVHAVLNTLTEHDYQDTFNKWQKFWEWCIQAELEYFKGDSGK
jgi:hypothetical protein